MSKLPANIRPAVKLVSVKLMLRQLMLTRLATPQTSDSFVFWVIARGRAYKLGMFAQSLGLSSLALQFFFLSDMAHNAAQWVSWKADTTELFDWMIKEVTNG